MFSPSLFYRDYILEEREEKTDKHLIEGKLIHLLLLQPEEFDKEFILSPSKTPSDAVSRVLKTFLMYLLRMYLNKVEDDLILVYLKKENLYQSFKDDQKRIDKIRTLDNAEYYKFYLQKKVKILLIMIS